MCTAAHPVMGRGPEMPVMSTVVMITVPVGLTLLLVAVSDQRDEGASGLLVRRREEHGHAGGAAGPRHPHLSKTDPESSEGSFTHLFNFVTVTIY